MLKLFINTLRSLQKCCPWLHWPALDRLMVKIWRWLLDLII
jgi:hypothetical protein